jgi:superfamily II DNA/RNA helicase
MRLSFQARSFSALLAKYAKSKKQLDLIKETKQAT